MHPDVERFLQTKIVGKRGQMLVDLAGFAKLDSLRTHPQLFPTGVSGSSSFYGTEEFQKDVATKLAKRFPNGTRNGPPVIWAGPCANGDVLVKNTELLRQWQQSARQIVDMETELAGVYAAARSAGRQNYPLLAIRGLSDIVGLNRNPDWTPYACHTAAATASAILLSGFIDFSRNLPNPSETSWDTDIGDDDFNRILQELNRHAAHSIGNSTQLRQILKEMFNRRAFSATVSIEEPRHFLFALCWAVRILNRYKVALGQVTGDPTLIHAIVEKLYFLRDTTAGFFGKNFDLDDHVRLYGKSKDQFIKVLDRGGRTHIRGPALIERIIEVLYRGRRTHIRGPALIERNKCVSELRDMLFQAGLLDSP